MINEIDMPPRKRQKYRNSSNSNSRIEGILRIGGANVRPRKYGRKQGHENIPVISVGKAPWNQLSPFNLGPVLNDQGEVVSKNVENYWNFHKVWEHVGKQKQKKSGWWWPSEQHVKFQNGGKDIEVLPAYWKWQEAGFKSSKAVRRPNGTARQLFSLFEGEHLNVVEARKRICIPA